MNYLRLVKCILEEKMLNGRLVAVYIIHFFVMHTYLKAILESSKTYDYPCSPWTLPFFFSSIYVFLICMLEVVYLYSDVPYTQYNKMYIIVRCGRKQWVLANILSIIIQAIGYMIISAFFSMIYFCGHIEYTAEWGKLLHTLAINNNLESMSIYLDISYESMVIYKPFQLMLMQMFVGILIISMIGLMMYAVSLWINRTASIIVSGIMILMVFLVDNSHPTVAKSISYITPVSWMLCVRIGKTNYGAYTLPPLWYIITASVVVCIILIILIYLKSKTMEYDFYKED